MLPFSAQTETQIQDRKNTILSLIKKILSSPKREYDGIIQYEFNCPSDYCKQDIDKFNWTFSAEHNIFRCWKCNYKGVIHKLIKDFGTNEDLKILTSVLPLKNQQKYIEELKNKKKDVVVDEHITCELPEGYKPLYGHKYNTKYYKMAMAYLRKRKITDDLIKKYNIGYTENEGSRKLRIIIPSYNIDGKINYYEARSYAGWNKPNYLKPDSPDKSDIIFNVRDINFDLPVYLTEGPFDMIPLYNCVPLLGKDISDYLLKKLIEHNSKVILCLDEDALKDSIELYNSLVEVGLDVYFVEVKDDIAKYFEKYGKKGIIELIRNYRKLDFEYIINMILKDGKPNVKKKKINEDLLNKEKDMLQRCFDEIEEENNEQKQ